MKLEYITAKGAVLDLMSNQHFVLSNIDGLTTASASFASSTIANMDGDFINSKRTIPRSVTLDFTINSNVEDNIRYILGFIKLKQKGYLRRSVGGRTLILEGVIESIEAPRYSQKVVMQVSLYCSNPYWFDAEFSSEEISEVLGLHYFTETPNDMLIFTDEGVPFGEYDTNRTKVISNTGDVEIGLEIHIIALGVVVNPLIQNSKGEFIGLNITMQSGDEIVINTTKGKKSIQLNGKNMLNNIMRGSTWLQLETGEEEFTIDSQDGTESAMYFSIIYKQAYV